MPHHASRSVLVWLSCTALAVTAVYLSVGFVVNSTAPLPPVARAVPTYFADTPTTSASPISASTPTTSPSGTGTPTPTPTPTPSKARPSTSAPPTTASDSGGTTLNPAAYDSACQGGVGLQTIDSVGGKATVRFGATGVCLVSAVPAPGFTTSTSQTSLPRLVVTFTGPDHESQITATVDCSRDAHEATRETSW